MTEGPYKPLHALNEEKPLMSDQTYDLLKKLVTIGLPAFGTLYVTVAALWGLPNPEAVSGTVLAVATFLGVLLNIAGRSYEKSDAKYDGVITVEEDAESGLKTAGLQLKKYENPADVVQQDTAVFKVVRAVHE